MNFDCVGSGSMNSGSMGSDGINSDCVHGKFVYSGGFYVCGFCGECIGREYVFGKGYKEPESSLTLPTNNSGVVVKFSNPRLTLCNYRVFEGRDGLFHRLKHNFLMMCLNFGVELARWQYVALDRYLLKIRLVIGGNSRSQANIKVVFYVLCVLLGVPLRYRQIYRFVMDNGIGRRDYEGSLEDGRLYVSIIDPAVYRELRGVYMRKIVYRSYIDCFGECDGRLLFDKLNKYELRHGRMSTLREVGFGLYCYYRKYGKSDVKGVLARLSRVLGCTPEGLRGNVRYFEGLYGRCV